ncbi:non-specific serine/threonine protein kinase [Halococcus morrhuae DSM 1307]|uniref:non-specific serine/threonine protein kinase n=1 Tax=Halococcus morrhuae DSM 1307 TaxID=931277 RepID=M0MEM5_HALMO|nr:serine/threonine-protein kinase Rio1 [Halococcus morrhuae]EMA42865.1 non-specific serine/threonine protein kinase [Halococcus morrhuae DSM 1307]
MSDEYGLLDEEATDAPGDEWENLDVADTEADRTARTQDREFAKFRERIKDADQFKVEGGVFDEATLGALYKLVQDGHIDALGGPISTGKEAHVFLASAGDHDVAVKIYRINASDFTQMRRYLEGDPRFDEIGGKKKAVVLAWTRKEFANLKRAKRAGLRVPEPLAVERNALVMEFLGTDGERARRLSELQIENPETAYEVVREYMRRLYSAGLVHGDLSEYNILVHDSQLWVLDLGQAVTIHHPNSREFLERDCENVASFFARQGLDADGESLLADVTAARED